MSSDTNKHAQTAPFATGNAESLMRGAAPRRRPFLLVYHRDRVETVHFPPGGELTVGREDPADVVIPDSSLSRRHARFTLEGADVFVEDLGSTNGTRMGRRRVTREVVRPGDAVTLGAIMIGVHVLPAAHTSFLDLDDHDSLRSAIDAEIARARFFGRPFALVTVRSREGRTGHVQRWSPRVRGLLRPVDRIALYSNDTVEILLPEMTRIQATSLAEAIVLGAPDEPPLGAGIACFPGASSADEVLQQSRRAALSTDAETSVRVAEPEGARPFPVEPEEGSQEVIARSARLRAVVALARRAGRAVVPVLLQGETGTGKEVLARFIHAAGPRKDKPMICVNCGALPAQLVESILFGHERGAFTGAVQQQKGVFEAADGGTVLLDEIGELPAAAQAALLRVLESKRLTRIGSTREIEVDVRIVAATHRDLEAMVAAGTFREDLYYRLCVMPLEIPPLRDRREDIPQLTARFVQEAAAQNGSPVRAVGPEVLDVLCQYSWPGNVRELRNVIERAVVVADGDTLTLGDLSERLRAAAASAFPGRSPTAFPAPPPLAAASPPPLAAASPPPQTPPPTPPQGLAQAPSPDDDSAPLTGGFRAQMDHLEASLLLRALRDARGSQAEAARLLDIPLRTLQHRLKAHGIRKGGYEGPPPKG